jgi:hypothetical protein
MLAVLMAGLSIVLIVISYRKARITAKCVHEKTKKRSRLRKSRSEGSSFPS